MTYDNTNSGILAANDRRRGDTDPTHTGSVNVDGVEFWISAWVNEGRAGSKLEGKRYFSLRLRPKDQQRAPATAKARPAEAATEDPNDDIPF